MEECPPSKGSPPPTARKWLQTYLHGQVQVTDRQTGHYTTVPRP